MQCLPISPITPISDVTTGSRGLAPRLLGHLRETGRSLLDRAAESLTQLLAPPVSRQRGTTALESSGLPTRALGAPVIDDRRPLVSLGPGGAHVECYFVARRDDSTAGLIRITQPECLGRTSSWLGPLRATLRDTLREHGLRLRRPTTRLATLFGIRDTDTTLAPESGAAVDARRVSGARVSGDGVASDVVLDLALDLVCADRASARHARGLASIERIRTAARAWRARAMPGYASSMTGLAEKDRRRGRHPEADPRTLFDLPPTNSPSNHRLPA